MNRINIYLTILSFLFIGSIVLIMVLSQFSPNSNGSSQFVEANTAHVHAPDYTNQ